MYIYTNVDMTFTQLWTWYQNWQHGKWCLISSWIHRPLTVINFWIAQNLRSLLCVRGEWNGRVEAWSIQNVICTGNKL